MSEVPIRILFSSDHHMGHHNINQEDMANAFVRTIFPLIEDSDIYFINGDFFDRLVEFDNYTFDEIYGLIMNIMTWCQNHHVVLRILQGTFTHDRNQCHRWNTFYKKGYYKFDFKYVNGIELEEITVRDRTLRVLYVQDDLPFKSSDDVLETITTKMRDLGWDYVDYGCMHGFFDFTFPSGVSQENTVVFRESQFPFVRKVIDVGHVHQHRIVGKVISNGSFDRLNHSDEDPKGCVKVLDFADHYTATFVVNKSAAIYDTLYISKDMETEDITTSITNHIGTLKTDRKISLRFVVDLSEHVSAIRAWMKEVYPDIAIAFKKSSDADVKGFVLTNDALFTKVEKRVAPTPVTLPAFIAAHIPEKYGMTIERIAEHLVPLPK